MQKHGTCAGMRGTGRPHSGGLSPPLDTSAPGWFHGPLASFRPPPRALVNLLLGGALLRLIGLGVHALWLDEGATWAWATKATWGGTVFAEANHPPAWWVVTRLWIEAFGDSEASLRAPAALLGLLSIYLSWLLARRLFDPEHRPSRGGFDHTPDEGRGARLALWIAGFVALSTYFTEYSQEARMYAALIAEALGLALLYLRWLDKGDRLSLTAYALLAALALYTQYFAIWIIAGHAVHALWLWWRGRRRAEALDPRPFLLACIGAGVLFLPWFFYLVSHYEGISTGESFEPFGRLFYVLWRIGVGPGLVVVDRLRLEDGIGSVLQDEWVLVLVTSLLWFAPVVLGARRLRQAPGVGSFVAANVLVPIGLLLLVFPFFALIHERYLVFLAPWLVILALLGACEAARYARPFLLGGLILLLGVSLVAYHTVAAVLVPVGPAQSLGGLRVASSYEPDPEAFAARFNHGHPFGKEPWRQAHAFVSSLALAEEDSSAQADLVLLHPPYLQLVWGYYDKHPYVDDQRPTAQPRLDLGLLPRETVDAAEVERRLRGQLQGRTRVFLVLAHEETRAADGTKNPDHYFEVLREILGRLWGEVEVVKPILFNCSWGVRVAVFNRR